MLLGVRFLIAHSCTNSTATPGNSWEVIHLPTAWGAARGQRLTDPNYQPSCLKMVQLSKQFTLQSFPQDEAEPELSGGFNIFAYLFSLAHILHASLPEVFPSINHLDEKPHLRPC